MYSPAITDFTVMVDQTSHMFITGPDVIKTVTGEDVGFEELGGARTHNSTSGVAHHMAGDEKDAVEYVKQLLSYLPSNNLSEPPAFPEEADLAVTDEDAELDTIVPDSANQPYDMHAVIEHVLDDAEFFETQPLYAPNILTGFGRVEGRPVGIVANQPMQFAGCLDITASEKAARFVRTCDAFNVPVITFVDVPGFLPGVDQEHDGIIRRGAKLIFAYAEATVPLITVITRKAFGGGSSPSWGPASRSCGRRRRADRGAVVALAALGPLPGRGLLPGVVRHQQQHDQGQYDDHEDEGAGSHQPPAEGAEQPVHHGDADQQDPAEPRGRAVAQGHEQGDQGAQREVQPEDDAADLRGHGHHVGVETGQGHVLTVDDDPQEPVQRRDADRLHEEHDGHGPRHRPAH
ncbi:Acetyl-coenzyme A carboxylase carboxyl transferase subunit alpha [Streptomyces tendae]